jgi:hypothetical protein
MAVKCQLPVGWNELTRQEATCLRMSLLFSVILFGITVFLLEKIFVYQVGNGLFEPFVRSSSYYKYKTCDQKHGPNALNGKIESALSYPKYIDDAHMPQEGIKAGSSQIFKPGMLKKVGNPFLVEQSDHCGKHQEVQDTKYDLFNQLMIHSEQ